MPNTLSVKKRARQSVARKLVNGARRTSLKSLSRLVEDALAQNDLEKARGALRVAEAGIARAYGKGLLKRNTASRNVSRLARKVAAALKAKPS